MKKALKEDNGESLKWRIVLGCMLVALIVTVIFFIVSLKVAGKVGQVTENNSLHSSIDLIRFNIESHPPKFDALHDKMELLAHYKEFAVSASDLSAIYFTQQNILNKIKNDVEPNVSEFLTQQISITRKGEYFGVLKDDNIAWHLSATDNSKIIIAKKLNSLSITMGIAYTKLSVTAFITFWFAVWTAMTLSSIIAKLFEKNRHHLTYVASHDFLTGLQNRYHFEKTVVDYIHRKNHSKAENKPSVLMSIDLNKFKCINDNFGHPVGDEVLVKMAERIKARLPEKHLISRTGGDEFFVWLFQHSTKDAEQTIRTLQRACAQPITNGINTFIVGASIGVTEFPKDGTDFPTLTKNADNAMYRAKQQRLGYAVFDPARDVTSEMDVSLAGDIKEAIDNDQFVLWFQPKIDLSSNNISGFELLVRWQHPVKGFLFPDTFIHLIEQSEYINLFTSHLIERAYRVASYLRYNGFDYAIAINLSPFNLLSNEVFECLKLLSDNDDLLPKLIEIELTETAAMNDEQTTVMRLNDFKSLGLIIALDDFGTGMSSLSYIRSLPIDRVKIDKSFIANIHVCEKSQAFYKGVTNLCQCLEIPVVAEGVETEEQALFLGAIHCEMGQGYYWSKPMAETALLDYCIEYHKDTMKIDENVS